MNTIKGGYLEKPKITNPKCFSTYTANSCYWAGFLAADGCISKGTLYLCLHSKDTGQIEKFQEFVGSNHKISINNDKYKRAQTAFVNTQINEDLYYNFNITERKTETYEMPLIPQTYLYDFIRGYFDGDGCICESFSNVNSVTATLYSTIVGSKLLIPELYDLIELKGTIQERDKVKVIKYCTKSAYKLLDRMYGNSPQYYLTRKYEYYKSILENGVKTR